MHDSAACDLDLQRRPVNFRDGATIQGVLTLHGGDTTSLSLHKVRSSETT